MYCRGDQWVCDCFDDSSDAWPARPDAADVGDFVTGFLAQDPFGRPVEHLEILIVSVLVSGWHQPVVARIMSLTDGAS